MVEDGDGDLLGDAMAFGTGYAFYRHGQDRLTEGIYRAVRAALQEWDMGAWAPDATHDATPSRELVLPVDLEGSGALHDWDDFIGQAALMTELRIRLESARLRRDRLPHTLLMSRRSGVGRRTAVRTIAKQAGKTLVELCAPFTVEHLGLALDHLGDGDLLFIDDLDRAHGLWTVGPTTLSALLESRDAVQQGGSRHAVGEITIIAASTSPDDVPSSLLDRFPVQLTVQDYSTSERAQLAVACAFAHGCQDLVSNELAADIGLITPGSGPGAVERLVLLVRDLATTLESPVELADLQRHAAQSP